jgi:hypothetical protein
MGTSKSLERKGSAAVRNGLFFGAISAAVYIVSAVVQDMTGTTVALITTGSAFRPLSLLNQASLIVALVLFLVAGWRTATAEGRLSSAAVAGLIAGLMVCVVEIATVIVNQGFLYSATINTLRSEQRLTDTGFLNAMFVNPVTGSLFTIILYSALGAGLGFVAGGLRGQIRQEDLWQ